MFDEAVAGARGAEIDYRLPYPKWELLWYLVEERRLLAHGTNEQGVQVFEPRENNDTVGRPGRVVYAASDGIWPMFFACLNRDGFRGTIWNSCIRLAADGRSRKFYTFSLAQEMLERERAWCQGAVYLLPRDGFRPVTDLGGSPLEEWASEQEVRPLAWLRVVPSDFPFCDDVVAHDPGHPERFAELLGGLMRRLEHLDELVDGFALRFPAEREVVGPLLELAGLMWRYQPYGVEIELSPGHGPVCVRLRGPDPAKELIAVDLRTVGPGAG